LALVYTGNISTSMYSPHICFLSLYVLCICLPFHVVVVLIPYTRPPYGTEVRPIGKCYGFSIEAEKIAFLELSPMIVEHTSKCRAGAHMDGIT
jgi:hypothetical protein